MHVCANVALHKNYGWSIEGRCTNDDVQISAEGLNYFSLGHRMWNICLFFFALFCWFIFSYSLSVEPDLALPYRRKLFSPVLQKQATVLRACCAHTQGTSCRQHNFFVVLILVLLLSLARLLFLARLSPPTPQKRKGFDSLNVMIRN